MTRRHRARPAPVLVVVIALVAVAVAGCSGAEVDSSGAGTSTVNATRSLGADNKATGTPIKVGFVADGATPSIDNSGYLTSAKATAAYANDHLGGINGHPIEIVTCEAGGTPSGATQCGVQMANEKVAAVLVSTLTNDVALYKALAGSGIPFVIGATAAQEILLGPNGYVFANPLGAISGPALVAKDKGVTKVANVLIDVPAATGTVTAVAGPIFKKAGVDIEIVPIAPSVADQVPQIQSALNNGAGLFAVAGDEPFMTKTIKALQQLGFDGPITTIASGFSDESIASMPNGLTGVIPITNLTADAADPDAKLRDEVMATYGGSGDPIFSSITFMVVLGLVRAVNGNPTAVDAGSIDAVLGAMPAPMPLPLGGGITFQCGAKLVPLTPNACITSVLETTLDADGNATGTRILDTTSIVTLG